mmetsp:Transcript_5875/g.22243  ORF Transcript_5875/g.22243 Transcript_5875/m.22243 type:complete len:205 (-) Transcript_5875:34-648(-)
MLLFGAPGTSPPSPGRGLKRPCNTHSRYRSAARCPFACAPGETRRTLPIASGRCLRWVVSGKGFVSCRARAPRLAGRTAFRPRPFHDRGRLRRAPPGWTRPRSTRLARSPWKPPGSQGRGATRPFSMRKQGRWRTGGNRRHDEGRCRSPAHELPSFLSPFFSFLSSCPSPYGKHARARLTRSRVDPREHRGNHARSVRYPRKGN